MRRAVLMLACLHLCQCTVDFGRFTVGDEPDAAVAWSRHSQAPQPDDEDTGQSNGDGRIDEDANEFPDRMDSPVKPFDAAMPDDDSWADAGPAPDDMDLFDASAGDAGPDAGGPCRTHTYFRDRDDDGFGGTTTLEACDRPDGYAIEGGDCDDACPDCHPGRDEVCDGLDNNCSGTVDDIGDLGCVAMGVCANGKQRCMNGVATCTIQPAAEACNAQDDDCDGNTDEKVLNACGGCGEVPLEVCNQSDDDCDGMVDEGLLNACGTCGPTPQEICSGQDDDCDGMVDEGLLNACGTCGPTPQEICNGQDDDCDTASDEDFLGFQCAPDDASGEYCNGAGGWVPFPCDIPCSLGCFVFTDPGCGGGCSGF